MSVVDVRLIRDGVGAMEGMPEGERLYLVQTSSVSDGAEAARDAVMAIAPPDGTYWQNVRAYNEGRNPLWFNVEARCKALRSETYQVNPVLRPAKIAVSWEGERKPYPIDALSTRVMLPNGELFDNPPTMRDSKPILRIAQNEAAFALAYYDQILFSVNQNPITIRGVTFAAEQLLFCEPEIEEMWEGAFHYYAVTYRLAVDKDLHIDKMLAYGWVEKVSSGVSPRPIFESDGARITRPWPLNVDGTKKANRTDPGAELDFYPYDMMNWGITFR